MGSHRGRANRPTTTRRHFSGDPSRGKGVDRSNHAITAVRTQCDSVGASGRGKRPNHTADQGGASGNALLARRRRRGESPAPPGGRRSSQKRTPSSTPAPNVLRTAPWTRRWSNHTARQEALAEGAPLTRRRRRGGAVGSSRTTARSHTLRRSSGGDFTFQALESAETGSTAIQESQAVLKRTPLRHPHA